MFSRLCKPLLSNSFFMFGARGTGKSTLVKHALSDQRILTFDLLDADLFDELSRSPQDLHSRVLAKMHLIDWILIDEVQKIPPLLDVVHSLMENHSAKHLKFALTGSSARKLKVAGANLLAGRAFTNDLYPLSCLELGEQFVLDHALNWGTLPKLFSFESNEEKKEYLRAYGRTYLKEEVWDERLINQLDPFRKFLEIAAQSNGTIVNYSKLAKQTGVDDKTIKKYFEILADTFIGFYLEAYSESVRVQQISSPKFYLFDPGVKRALEGMLNVPVVQRTFSYGKAFEHFLICECVRLNQYKRLDFKFSYLKTKSDLEIDLIVQRPGGTRFLIEIKSGEKVTEDCAKTLMHFRQAFPEDELRIWSNDLTPYHFLEVRAVHWREGLAELFGL